MDQEKRAAGGSVRGRAEEMTERQPEKQTANQFGKVSRFAVHAEKQGERTVLSDVSFTAPYKLMAPFEKPDGGIQIMPLCASAGIMRGDRQEFSYEAAGWMSGA